MANAVYEYAKRRFIEMCAGPTPNWYYDVNAGELREMSGPAEVQEAREMRWTTSRGRITWWRRSS